MVVLLSHHRPQNLPLLVRAALRNGFVRKIVVSNSNRNVDIADWIDIRDARLALVDEQEPTQPGHRFVLAERESGEYFLSIDDDIFLTPHQWAELFKRLVCEEDVPHGILGNVYRPGTVSSNGSPFHHVSDVEQKVDVLIGAYAFTRKHVQRMFDLAERLGISRLTDLRNGEDVLLSFAGSDRPRIHDLGRLWMCAMSSLPGVAIWRSEESFGRSEPSFFSAPMRPA